MEPATGLKIVWCLVATLQPVIRKPALWCHHAWNLLISTNLYLAVFWKMEEEADKWVGSEGTSHPLRAPGDSYVTETTNEGALQRSHGGGARGISSWAGAASALVVGLATLLVHLGPNGRAAVRLWANKYSRIGAGFIIVRRPLSRCTNPSTLSPTFRCEIKKTTAIVEFDQGDKNSAPMLIKSI